MTLSIGVRLSIFYNIVNSVSDPALVYLTGAVVSSYLAVCAFYSMFRLRLSSFYHLHFGRHSEANSLLFNASYILRLVFPIGVNVFSMTKDDRGQTTAFESVLGVMNVVPLLGEKFNLFVPIVISVFCFITLANFYGRILRCLQVRACSVWGGAPVPGTDSGPPPSSWVSSRRTALVRMRLFRRVRAWSSERRGSGNAERPPASTTRSRGTAGTNNWVPKWTPRRSRRPISCCAIIYFLLSASFVYGVMIASGDPVGRATRPEIARATVAHCWAARILYYLRHIGRGLSNGEDIRARGGPDPYWRGAT